MRLIRVTTAEQLTDKAKVTFAIPDAFPVFLHPRAHRYTGVILRTALPGVFFLCSGCTILNGGHPREAKAAGTLYAYAIRDTSSTQLVERLRGLSIFGLSLMVKERPQT